MRLPSNLKENLARPRRVVACHVELILALHTCICEQRATGVYALLELVAEAGTIVHCRTTSMSHANHSATINLGDLPFMRSVMSPSTSSSSVHPRRSSTAAPQYHTLHAGDRTRTIASRSSVTSRSAHRLRLEVNSKPWPLSRGFVLLDVFALVVLAEGVLVAGGSRVPDEVGVLLDEAIGCWGMASASDMVVGCKHENKGPNAYFSRDRVMSLCYESAREAVIDVHGR